MPETFTTRAMTSLSSDVDRVTDILVAAFKDDIVSRSMIGGDDALMRPFYHASASAGVLGGRVWVTQTETGDVVGVAICFAPQEAFLSSEEQRAAGWDAFWALLDDETKKWWMEQHLPKQAALETDAYGQGTKLNAWHIILLAVDPAYRGRGIASSLIKLIMDEAKQGGVPVTVNATEDGNRAFYEHRGFEECGRADWRGKCGTWVFSCHKKQ